MEKMDARKRYTQMVLKQSFLTLLKEKPVNKITVKEVCALALRLWKALRTSL